MDVKVVLDPGITDRTTAPPSRDGELFSPGSTIGDNALAQAAISYAALHQWPVFPLQPRSKVPLAGSRGHLGATIDLATIQQWWRQRPDANIGLAVKPARLVVVDVDGPEGLAGLREIVGEPTVADDVTIDPLFTLTVQSGKEGGQHFYFRCPPGLVVPRKIGLRPALDLLGDGYVVAPPSIHPATGKPYVVRALGPVVLPMLPAPITTALESQAHARRRAVAGFLLPETVPAGTRDDALFRFACWLRGVCGLKEDAIAERLLAVNRERCDPPLEEATVRTKAARAARYEIDDKLDDIVNAERFIQYFGDTLKYVKGMKSWFIWNGRYWQRDEKSLAKEHAKAVARSWYALAADEDDAAVRKAILKHAGRSANIARLDAMMGLAQSDPAVALTGREFDNDLWALNVENGTVDLRSGVLRPHRRDDLLTKLAPVQFDPLARAPRWEQFLDEIMAGDPEMTGFLRRAVGYSLTGDVGEECVFFAYGTGANGKTKMLEALRAVLGDYAMDTNFATFLDQQRTASGPTPDIARLRGARFVTAVEAPAGKPFNEAVLKKAVGGDVLTARHLYQEEMEYRPQFKIWFAANHRPPVREQGEAFWRRMRMISFSVTIPEERRDRRLLDKLKAEAPGIFNWALAGALEWQRTGLREPEGVKKATMAYREENDSVGEFLAGHCETDPDALTPSGELYQRYIQWHRETYGDKSKPMNHVWFGRLLGEKGFDDAKSHHQRVRRGLKLKATEPGPGF
jgi:putative DNA primase/helicase